MRCFRSAMAVVLVALFLSACGTTSHVFVPGWQWVVVEAMGGSFKKGDVCGIVFGGILELSGSAPATYRTPLKTSEPLHQGENPPHYLVVNPAREPIAANSQKIEARGTECPDGVKVKVDNLELSAMTGAYHDLRQVYDRQIKQVSQLYSPNGAIVAGSGEVYKVEPEHVWVRTLNLLPVFSQNSKWGFWQHCTITKGVGTYQKIGDVDNQPVYHYRRDNQAAGSVCPTGVFFQFDDGLPKVEDLGFLN